MKKEDAIKIITKCVSDYQSYLSNKNILFVYGTLQNPNYLEATFLPRHFLHLTGVEINKNRIFSSTDFYKRALNNRLSPHDFSFPKNGTAELKLMILPSLMKIHCSAKMIGDYNFVKPILYTEKLVGNITACLGFVKDADIEYYIPNTVLQEDIRDITQKPQQRILAVLRKNIKQENYEEICYLAKGISLQDISEIDEWLLTDILNKDERSDEDIDWER